MRPTVLIAERHVGRNLHEQRAGPFAVLVHLAVFQSGELIDLDFAVDRIEGDDGGEQGRVLGAAGDEIALGHACIADSTADRRTNLGKLEVEPCGAHRRLGGMHGGLLAGGALDAALGLFERDRLALPQRRGVFCLGGGEFGVDLRLGQDGFDTFHDGLIGPRVDGEKQVARLHLRAFLEADLVHIAGHAGADLHLLAGGEAAGELVPVRQTAGDGFGHGHGDGVGRWCAAGAGGVAFARGQAENNKKSCAQRTPGET